MIALKFGVRSILRKGTSLLLVIPPAVLLFSMLTFVFATEVTLHDLEEGTIGNRAIRLGVVPGYPLVGFWYTRPDLNKFASIPGVSVGGGLFVPCYVDESDQHEFTCGSANRTFMLVHDHTLHVTEADLDRWDAVKDGAVITRAIADKHHWKVGSHIKIHRAYGMSDIDLTVTGVQDKYVQSDAIYYHNEYDEQRSPNRDPVYWSVWLLVDKPERRQAVLTQVDQDLTAIRRPHTIWKGEDTIKLLLGSSKTLTKTFELGGMISFFLVVCLSMTLLIVSIEQRTTEFAALIAIGYRRGLLARSVIVEGMLLMFISSFIGALAIFLLFHENAVALNRVVVVKVSPAIALGVILGGTLLGLLTSIVPAWRLARIDVLSSLR